MKKITKKQKIQLLYNAFNVEYFNSELPKIPISIVNSTKYMGSVSQGKVSKLPKKLSISSYQMQSNDDTELHSTLIHEMVHVYEIVTLRVTATHGEFFKKECERFAKLGYDITERVAPNSVNVKSMHFAIAKAFNDSEFGYMFRSDCPITPDQITEILTKRRRYRDHIVPIISIYESNKLEILQIPKIHNDVYKQRFSKILIDDVMSVVNS